MSVATEVTGTGPDLVFLHGWGMNGAVWDPLLGELQARFRVTRVDLPGHGESPWDSRLTTLEQWAETVLEAVPPGAAWVGWSLGGLVMLQAAQLAPGRMRALVGIATTPCFVRRQDWEPAMEPGLLQQFALQLQKDRQATLKRFLALQFQGVPHGRDLQRRLVRLLDSRPAPRSGALHAGLRLLLQNQSPNRLQLQSDLRQELGAMEAPALWILGERDRLLPPALAGRLRELAPRLEVQRLPGAGHAPFLSHPARVAGLLGGFLSHE